MYRKPTHTDQYLQWNSHHHLSAKFSVINTLKHRTKTVCSNQHLLKLEKDHLNKALKRCKYPDLSLSRATINQKKKTNTNQGTTNTTNKRGSNKKPNIVVPYIQGMRDSCKNISRKHGVDMLLQRMQYNQGPPSTPQRQRHHPAKVWSHLQVQVWQGKL